MRKKKKKWPRPLLGRAGNNKKEGGSSYKVVRPPLMVNKATTAGPFQTHNNNHSRSAFNTFQQFSGIFFHIHHCASVPSSCRSMTVKYRSFQPLSAEAPIRVFFRFLSLFSVEVLSSPYFQVRETRGEEVLMPHVVVSRKHDTTAKIRALDVCSNSISAHMFHSVLQTLPQWQRSRMRRFGFTPSGSKGRYSE